jgi:pimeloyl-ACP methyl ester carboxylesterase
LKVRTLESGVFVRYREGEPGYPALFCVHGFGASGASYLEAFDAPELQRHPIYAPDFPGFGESPRGALPGGLSGAADVLLGLVAAHGGGKGIVLLAHSAGGLIGTKVAPALPSLRCLINIEGNITEADNFISGKAAAAEDIDAWRRGLLEDLRGRAGTDEAYRRYLPDLARASSAALREWAVETVAETGKTRGGEGFRALTCRKLYIYGGRSIAEASLEYLVRHDVPRLAFPEAGHSPMIDEPARFYAAVAEFIAGWSR